jgi:hypothetical protein
VHRALQPQQVLPDERIVQVVLGLQRGDDRGAGRVGSEQHLDGVAGRQIQQAEDQERDQQEQDDQGQDAADQKDRYLSCAHAASGYAPVARWDRPICEASIGALAPALGS